LISQVSVLGAGRILLLFVVKMTPRGRTRAGPVAQGIT